MIAAALILLAYAAILSAASPSLSRQRWTGRSPRLAIAMWIAVSGSIFLSVGVSGVLMIQAWREHHGGLSPTDDSLTIVIINVAIIAASLIATASVISAAATTVIESKRERAHHRFGIRAAAAQMHPRGVTVLPSSVPAAYCLAGKPALIVVTSAAVEALTANQLDAVIAHERAHLRGHHHGLVAVAQTAARAFPFVPAMRAFERETARLVELLADDCASKKHDRRVIAEALVALASQRTPGLAAASTAALERVNRLIHRSGETLSTGQKIGIAAAFGLMLFVPTSLTSAATAASQALGICA